MPKLLAEIVISYKDGSMERIATDSGWKMHAGPLLYNHSRSGEIYDARLEIEGWNLPDFNEEDWEDGMVTNGPGGILKKNSTRPIRCLASLQPVFIGNGIYDLLENISGCVL